MKIEYNHFAFKSKQMYELEQGECFIYENSTYMKTDISHYENDKYNCINLKSGLNKYVEIEEFVVKINAKVVIDNE